MDNTQVAIIIIKLYNASIAMALIYGKILRFVHQKCNFKVILALYNIHTWFKQYSIQNKFLLFILLYC